MMDAAEALTNATLGLIVSWAVTYWLLPIWGLHPTAAASLGITAMYFVISFARSWALRKLFRAMA
jgi:O-antigen/teichoic acid export membrane protein